MVKKISNDITNHFGDVANNQHINPKTGMMKQNRMIILGPSNSGKNNCVYEILKRSPKIYNELHIICRNKDQPCYDKLEEKLGDFVTFYDADNIPKVDDFEVEYDDEENPKKRLVIIDDFSNDNKLQKEVFSHYFTRGRHKHLSTIYLCHAYHLGCDKMIRLNADYLIILKTNSKADLNLIMQDFMIEDMDKKQIEKHYYDITKKKGDCLLFNKLHGGLYHNFHKRLN